MRAIELALWASILACTFYVAQCDLAHKFNAQLKVKTVMKPSEDRTAFTYENRTGGSENTLLQATSRGEGWSIAWDGAQQSGATPIAVVKATLMHLQTLQKTASASTQNGKLIVSLTQAIEEFEGTPPTVGGDLNKLIPK